MKSQITSLSKQLFHGTTVNLLTKEEDKQIMQVQNESGDGLMSTYFIFPGIRLMYNDFHMHSCESRFRAEVNMFSINHCREGRMEQEVADGTFLYLGAGDVSFDRCLHGSSHVEFPLNHYHGVSISFILPEAAHALSRLNYDFPVDLYALQQKYCHGRHSFIMQNEPGLERIFSTLYHVPCQIRAAYFRVKIQELLLYLDALRLPSGQEERPYFYKSQVEKTKAIHALLTDRMSQHFTLQELSRRFDFPMTAMKTCFKNIYGDSIFSYMRTYRMNQASVLLKHNREKSVMEIAAQMGYESPGKFSTAFKEIMGISPLAYRKNSDGLDKNKPLGEETV